LPDQPEVLSAAALRKASSKPMAAQLAPVCSGAQCHHDSFAREITCAQNILQLEITANSTLPTKNNWKVIQGNIDSLSIMVGVSISTKQAKAGRDEGCRRAGTEAGRDGGGPGRGGETGRDKGQRRARKRSGGPEAGRDEGGDGQERGADAGREAEAGRRQVRD
jgi:hypothetical protein